MTDGNKTVTATTGKNQSKCKKNYFAIFSLLQAFYIWFDGHIYGKKLAFSRLFDRFQ